MLGRAGPNMPDTCSSGPACHASRPAAPGDTGGDPRVTRAGRDQSPPQHPETSISGSTRSQEHQANQDEPEGSQPAGQVQQQLGRGSKNCSFTPQKSELAHHLSKKCSFSAIITLLLAACSP